MRWLFSSQALFTAPPALDQIGPGTDRPLLVADLRGDDFAGHASPFAWLKNAPCPVIAIADADAPAIHVSPFDVVLADEKLLERIVAVVEHAPLAAMSFVQTLRAIQGVAPAAALTVESLAYGLLQSGPEFREWRAARPAQVQAPNSEPPAILERDSATLRIILNRPDNRNAISVAMRDALVAAFDLGVNDSGIESVILQGAGKCFSVGGELAEFGLSPNPVNGHWVRSVRSPAMAALRCGSKLTAEVHGASIGAGVELAAFAHHVIATENAFFQLPELTMGLIPGSGGCVSLSRRIGRQRTALMGLSAKRITATTALDWGLIDRIVG
jgi:enoyl-CoA hydratase